MRRAVFVSALLLMVSLFGITPQAEAQHVKLTATQAKYRTLYTTTVGISAHQIIEEYLTHQYLHVPPHSPGPLSPTPVAEKIEVEKWLKQANVSFLFPLPPYPGNGGRFDFAAKYTDSSTGKCYWEVHEIKPSSWHFNGKGQQAVAQLQSYIQAIEWAKGKDKSLDGCSARPATRWKEGQPSWRTIPDEYAPLYAAYGVKLQVQTWYRSQPGIVYYRFVWKDRSKRQEALKKGLSRTLAELVNKIARNELDLSNRYVYGELLPWMWAIRHEDQEAGGAWEDTDALQELIDIKHSLDNPATRVDEDENTDVGDRQRNATDMDVTTVGMMKYWEALTTPDPWYFKDWQSTDGKPWLTLPDGYNCLPQLRNPGQPYKCS